MRHFIFCSRCAYRSYTTGDVDEELRKHLKSCPIPSPPSERESTEGIAWGRLILSRSQQMALQSLLVEYMRHPDATEVFVDVLNDVETTPSDLLLVISSRRDWAL